MHVISSLLDVDYLHGKFSEQPVGFVRCRLFEQENGHPIHSFILCSHMVLLHSFVEVFGVVSVLSHCFF